MARNRLVLLVLAGLAAWSGAALALPGDPTDVLYPGDPSSYQDFGRSVAAHGNLVLVGAVGVKTNNVIHGAAYLFDRTTGQQLHKLVASDGADLDQFGKEVDLHGNLAVIGAPNDGPNGTRYGSAYVFDVTTGQELLKLEASDGAVGDNFGWSVGISGNNIIVGSPKADAEGANSGTAYFFDATTGQETGKWIRGDGMPGDNFGWCVDIDGFKAVAGAPYDSPAATFSGSVYVYDLLLSLSQGKLNRTDGAQDDRFGFSVALDSGTALVGAPYDDDNGGDSGSAYLFDVGNGLQLDKLLPNDGQGFSIFGISVDIEGNNAVVGAHFDKNGGTRTGSAYLFDTVSGQQVDKLTDPAGSNQDWFGWSVAIAGSTALVGSYQDDNNGTSSGSVFVFNTCPDSLLLTASPGMVVQDDDLYLTTFGGVTGRPNILFAVDVSGIPTIFQVASGRFDSECKHYVIATVPGGLAGLDVTFLAVGWGQSGFQLSNQATVQFQ